MLYPFHMNKMGLNQQIQFNENVASPFWFRQVASVTMTFLVQRHTEKISRTSPTLHPPFPPTVLYLSCSKVSQCMNCCD